MTYVAFLRGINLGGKNRLSMTELAAMFAAAGCSDVKTYIQSGNVLFKANARMAARVPAAIQQRIAGRFGYRVPVVLRTAAELAAVARNNPFLSSSADIQRLHVMFLDEKPDSRKVAALDPTRSPPDEFRVRGREVYLHLPNGVARTKLSNEYFDRTLATLSTGRNWQTVLKLAALADMT